MHRRHVLAVALGWALAGCASGGTTAADRGGSTVEYVPLGRTLYVPPSAIDAQTPSSLRSASDASEPWSSVVSRRCAALEQTLRVAAMTHAVDIGLIAGIVKVESNFDPDAVSRAGALGLMQVMPSNRDRLDCGDLTEPKANLACGMEVLGRFLRHYDGDVILGLSAYNAGYRPANAARDNDALPSNFRYVEKVLGARVSYLRHGCGAEHAAAR